MKPLSTEKAEEAVLAAAQEWHAQNVRQGLVAANFLGHTKKLWDACDSLARLKKAKP